MHQHHLRAASFLACLWIASLSAAGDPDHGAGRAGSALPAPRPAATSPTTQPAEGPALRSALDVVSSHDKPSILSARNPQLGVREISVKAPPLSATVRRDAKGISLIIVEVIRGEQITETYAAADEKVLKNEYPAAFKFYDTLITDLGGPGSDDLRTWFEQADAN